MMILRKSMTLLGSITLVVFILAALAPKAARGVAAAMVQVTNTTATPVPTSDVAPTQMFESECTANTAPSDTQVSCALSVPAGKRLVIQSVGISTVSAVGNRVITAQFGTLVSGSFVEVPVIVPFVGSQSNADFSTTSQNVRFYADGDLFFTLNFSQATGASITCTVVGYLVNIP